MPIGEPGPCRNRFWVEWPGSKDRAWITNAGEASWKFTQGSNGGPNPNPYELPSPLEVDLGYGVIAGQVFSDVSDGTSGGLPTALLPVAWPTGGWSLSVEGWLWNNLATSYLGIGVTDSGATLSNLSGPARVALLMRPVDGGQALGWELWTGGATRTLVASGPMLDDGFNRLQLTYDETRQLLTVVVNGITVGAYPMNLGRPRYAAFEGVGMVDNFVIRKLPTASAQ